MFLVELPISYTAEKKEIRMVQHYLEDYGVDRNWADQINYRVAALLFHLLHTPFREANNFQDMQEATDFVDIATGETCIGVRMRRDTCIYRDVTFRAKRDTGVPTELDKLLTSPVRYYLYGWVNKQHYIHEWVLLDLDVLRRRSGEVHEYIEDLVCTPNFDGTYFKAVSIRRLEKWGAIVAKQLEE